MDTSAHVVNLPEWQRRGSAPDVLGSPRHEPVAGAPVTRSERELPSPAVSMHAPLRTFATADSQPSRAGLPRRVSRLITGLCFRGAVVVRGCLKSRGRRHAHGGHGDRAATAAGQRGRDRPHAAALVRCVGYVCGAWVRLALQRARTRSNSVATGAGVPGVSSPPLVVTNPPSGVASVPSTARGRTRTMVCVCVCVFGRVWRCACLCVLLCPYWPSDALGDRPWQISEAEVQKTYEDYLDVDRRGRYMHARSRCARLPT
jgi:hypothetical protein